MNRINVAKPLILTLVLCILLPFTASADDDHGNTYQTATLISLNTDVSGEIESAGDVDWFKFSAVAYTPHMFELTVINSSDFLFADLYDTDGTTSLTEDGATVGMWTPTSSGTYYVKVLGWNSDDMGQYTLSITGNNSTTTTISYNPPSTSGSDGGSSKGCFIATASYKEISQPKTIKSIVDMVRLLLNNR